MIKEERIHWVKRARGREGWMIGNSHFLSKSLVFGGKEVRHEFILLPFPKFNKGLGTSVHIVKITAYQKK